MNKGIVLLLAALVLTAGCAQKSPQEACLENVDGMLKEQQEIGEIKFTHEIMDSSSFGSYDAALKYMSGHGVKEEVKDRVKADFTGGVQPVVIAKTDFTALGTEMRYIFGLVCNGQGDVQDVSSKIVLDEISW